MRTDDGHSPAHSGAEQDRLEFAKRLETAIGDQSRRAFAKAAGISAGALNQYVTGKSEPTRPVMNAIARTSGVLLRWLATGEGPMRPETATPEHSAPSPAAAPVGQVNFTPELEIIIGNAVAGMEHWRRRDALPISPELEGKLTAHICSVLVRRLNWYIEHGETPPDYLVTDRPYDFIADMEKDQNPEVTELAAIFRMLASRAR